MEKFGTTAFETGDVMAPLLRQRREGVPTHLFDLQILVECGILFPDASDLYVHMVYTV